MVEVKGVGQKQARGYSHEQRAVKNNFILADSPLFILSQDIVKEIIVVTS
jgi:hypothetical protein